MKNIAVKELAYFICQSGNLTAEFSSNHDMKRGTDAHVYLQSKYNEDSKAEVYIKKELNYLGADYLLHGFIDGVLYEDGNIVIEEIKSTSTDLDLLTTDYHKEHMAQLKIYGYLYALLNDMDNIQLRLTYISIIDYETKSFDSVFSIDTLEEFTFSVLSEYISWLNMLDESYQARVETLASIEFPFKNKRPGQHELMAACYQTMINKEILYTIAPTGIGKTMATIFSSLKALGVNDKLFYLTAKGSGKNAPIDALKLLESQGLRLKAIDITAKRKICNCGKKNCNPDDCPFALGYFDRLKSATFDIFEKYNIYDSESILEVANRFNICAFEFSLYLSYFCDVVIADYNYVFDPKAHLIRYFEDDTYHPKILVDEAHNLISRSKEMYSSEISEADVRMIRKALTGLKPSVRSTCNKLIDELNEFRAHLAPNALYCDVMPSSSINALCKELALLCDQVFEENKGVKDKDLAMDGYFKLLDMVRIGDIYSDKHRTLVKLVNDDVCVKYMCLDASSFLLETIKESVHGIVFFSATLYPIDYHANLLTCGEGKYLELQSPFDPGNLDIIINNSISTKYKNREASIDTILEAIEVVTTTNPGNYIVFFPSYQYLNMVLDNLSLTDYEIISQNNNMTDKDRNLIIDAFKNSEKNHLGLFVMGGAFSEGIDFIGDALSGVIIVGVGLPMVCEENNILKDYFEEEYHKGFDYAYTYPGFTKVIQAVGRVIRTESDKGIALLLDERFTYSTYLSLMPRHWLNKKVINNSYDLKKELLLFNKNIE